MTNRQKVLLVFPDAVLEYYVQTANTMAPSTYYKILINKRTVRLAIGRTKNEAWMNAKNKLQELKII